MAFRVAVVFIIGCIYFNDLSAQDSSTPLNTDRPGQSMNAFTTMRKSMLLQAGYSYTREAFEGNTYNFHASDFQLRYGVFDRIEFSLTGLVSYLDFRLEEEAGDFSEFSWDNIGLNARVNAYQGKGAIPAVGLELGVVRTGFDRDIPWLGDVRAVLSLVSQISPKMTLTGNLARLNPDQAYGTLNLAFAGGAKWTVFGEYVQFFQEEGALDSFVNFGGAFLVNGDFQVDLTGGVLARNEGGDSREQFYIQAGLTKRFRL